MIPISKPYIGESEKRAVLDVLDSGWLVQGKYVADCERWMCSYTGSGYSACTTSCTTALHLALLAVGVGPGDEVPVPSFTWIASANSVKYCGATPVFVDVLSDTYNIDPDLIECLITSRYVLRAIKNLQKKQNFRTLCFFMRTLTSAYKEIFELLSCDSCYRIYSVYDFCAQKNA